MVNRFDEHLLSKTSLKRIVKRNVLWKVLFPVFVAFHVLMGASLLIHIKEHTTNLAYKSEKGVRTFNGYVQNLLMYLRICAVETTLSMVTGTNYLEKYSLPCLTQYFYNLSLINTNGRFVLSLYPPHLQEHALSLHYRTKYSLISRNYFEITSPYYSTVSHTIVWGIKYYNLPNYYTLIGEVNLRKFWKFAGLALQGNDFTFYVDDYGNYLIHPDFEKVNSRENLSYSWFKKAQKNTFITGKYNGFGKYEGKWFLISGRYSYYTNTWCFVLFPLKTILSPLLKIYLMALFFLFIFLLIYRLVAREWIDKNIIFPLEDFGKFIAFHGSGNNQLNLQLDKNFLPFREGHLLEQTFLSTMKDLRDREQALKESETKYRVLFESANDAIFIIEKDKFIDCNEKALEMFNCRLSDLLGKHPWELSPDTQPDGRNSKEKAKEKINKVLEGIPQRFEWVHTRCDGSEFYTEISLTVLPYGKFCSLAIVRDITKNKEFEKALKESERKFRTLVETAPIGIMVFQDNKFVFVNPEVEKYTEYSKEELLSLEPFWKIIDSRSWDTIKKITEKCLHTSKSFLVPEEFDVITKSGRRKTFRCTLSSITIQGKPAGIITAMDVTILKETEKKKQELERMLYRSQRLESLGTLVAGVAHEFNNLLQAIILNIDQLKVACDQVSRAGIDGIPDVTKCYEYFQNIQQLYDRARTLIRELLIFSRDEQYDAGEKVELSLHDEINRVISVCKSVFPSSIGIEVSFDARADKIWAQAGSVEQVFMNILNNARDAILEKDVGGQIRISTRNTRLGKTNHFLYPGKLYLVVTIEDSGIGIDPKDLDKIYDPFFTTKPPGKGTGLGLSVVYGIVQELGGFITCESQKGEGTTFRLYFPILEECKTTSTTLQHEAEPTEEIVTSTGKRQRILIVEDEQLIGRLMANFLNEAGFDALHLSTPDEALQKIDELEESYDLIITDLGLPGIGGEELINEIRKRGLTMPIIVITGYLTSREEAKHLKEKLGVVSFLFKPFEMKELKNAVIKALK